MAKGELIAQHALSVPAEQQVARKPAVDGLMNDAEKDRLLHDMRLHQTELKLQNRALRERQASLQESLESHIQENLRQLEVSRHIVTAQEKERRQLALDLHDIVSPNMAAVKANLLALRSSLPPPVLEQVAGRMHDIEALLDDTTCKLRELGNELRPVILDYLGLYAALESYIEQFAARTGVKVEISGANDESDGRRLPPDVESKLFRIAQEALTNSAKHARAKRILVRIEHDTRHGTLLISDDGAGFDLKTLGTREGSPGLGLLTMKERAEFVGGTCRIESEPGGGTRVIVDF